VSYSDNDNCVVARKHEITKKKAKGLKGKTVACRWAPPPTMEMSHFAVDLASLKIVNMSPPEGAAALAQGSVDFACGYGGGLTRMKEYGNVLLTGKEREARGILAFDVHVKAHSDTSPISVVRTSHFHVGDKYVGQQTLLGKYGSHYCKLDSFIQTFNSRAFGVVNSLSCIQYEDHADINKSSRFRVNRRPKCPNWVRLVPGLLSLVTPTAGTIDGLQLAPMKVRI